MNFVSGPFRFDPILKYFGQFNVFGVSELNFGKYYKKKKKNPDIYN